MLKYSFPSTFIIPCSVFCGSLFADTCLPAVAYEAKEGHPTSETCIV